MLDVQKSSLPPFGGGGSHMKMDVEQSTPLNLKCSPEYLQPAKADSMTSTETLKGEDVPTETLKSYASGIAIMQNLEAAKVATAFIMNIPEAVVQLVIDGHRLGLDPTLAFSNSEQLASAALDVASSPQRQGDLARKIHQAQKTLEAQKIHQGEKVHKGEKTLQGKDTLQAQKTLEGEGIHQKMHLAEEMQLKHQQQGREAGEKAAAWMGMSGAGVGVSAWGDCQKHLAGMPEACQSAAECCTTTSSPSTKNDQKNEEKIAEQDNSKDISGSQYSQSGCDKPAAEMLHGHENGKASTTSPSNAFHTPSDLTTTPTPKAQLRQRLQVLAAENRKLKNRKVCRACQKVDLAESGITFLPCGHFITCEACSEMFDDCPACGKNILGTVRTFLS